MSENMSTDVQALPPVHSCLPAMQAEPLPSDDELLNVSDYEGRRKQNIAKNKALLATLGLDNPDMLIPSSTLHSTKSTGNLSQKNSVCIPIIYCLLESFSSMLLFSLNRV